ncbi:MAG: hypothetical protein AAGF20_08475 [Pseudomonadota bacterium]
MIRILIPAMALALSGCATLVDGTSQQIQLTSNAPGATCGITQNGAQIVAPAPVPATHSLSRRAGNLIVTCQAPGFQPNTQALVTGRNPKTVALMMPAILLDAGADAALGGLAEYQNEAYIHLVRSR